jgi:hypothetical protein
MTGAGPLPKPLVAGIAGLSAFFATFIQKRQRGGAWGDDRKVVCVAAEPA